MKISVFIAGRGQIHLEQREEKMFLKSSMYFTLIAIAIQKDHILSDQDL